MSLAALRDATHDAQAFSGWGLLVALGVVGIVWLVLWRRGDGAR